MWTAPVASAAASSGRVALAPTPAYSTDQRGPTFASTASTNIFPPRSPAWTMSSAMVVVSTESLAMASDDAVAAA
ncbi:hypothetical protein [Nannocystis sp.]|uniref:hypothetical protein n=1 Tax=Nannocystis sp. TaxID=1962667 RepID=UPI0025EC52F7|nr:hypothetical protein [Nannocystis sp.]MBK7827023.1 hypothetical protein [Nannocystis sp.]